MTNCACYSQWTVSQQSQNKSALMWTHSQISAGWDVFILVRVISKTLPLSTSENTETAAKKKGNTKEGDDQPKAMVLTSDSHKNNWKGIILLSWEHSGIRIVPLSEEGAACLQAARWTILEPQPRFWILPVLSSNLSQRGINKSAD